MTLQVVEGVKIAGFIVRSVQICLFIILFAGENVKVYSKKQD